MPYAPLVLDEEVQLEGGLHWWLLGESVEKGKPHLAGPVRGDEDDLCSISHEFP